MRQDYTLGFSGCSRAIYYNRFRFAVIRNEFIIQAIRNNENRCIIHIKTNEFNITKFIYNISIP